MLTEKIRIITNDREISNAMNNYFTTEITKHLNLQLYVISHSEPLEKIIGGLKVFRGLR